MGLVWCGSKSDVQMLEHLCTRCLGSVEAYSEFGQDPLLYGPTQFSTNKTEIPENGEENMDMLADLLQQRVEEMDIVPELDILIDNICTTRVE